jgi:hypothetical protein
MENKTLHLTLKKKWFKLTEANIKPEDYREITPFWCARLLTYDGYILPQKWWKQILESNTPQDLAKDLYSEHSRVGTRVFDFNRMTLGYPKADDASRILTYEHGGIEIREGREEWGAEPGKLYIVIKHGKL